MTLKFCNIPDPGPLDGIYGPQTRNVMGWVYHNGVEGKRMGA